MFENDDFHSNGFLPDNWMKRSTEKHCYSCVHETRSDVFTFFFILEIKIFKNSYQL